jgi:hypothetical protein
MPYNISPFSSWIFSLHSINWMYKFHLYLSYKGNIIVTVILSYTLVLQDYVAYRCLSRCHKIFRSLHQLQIAIILNSTASIFSIFSLWKCMHLNIVNSRCMFMFVSMLALYSFVLCKCFQPLSFWAAFKFVWSQLFLKSMFWFLHFWVYYASDA